MGIILDSIHNTNQDWKSVSFEIVPITVLRLLKYREKFSMIIELLKGEIYICLFLTNYFLKRTKLRQFL